MSDKTLAKRNERLGKINIEDIRNYIKYDPLAGDFVWLKDTAKHKLTGKKAGFEANGYLYVGIFGQRVLGHLLAWMLTTGEIPLNFIDHKNGNPLDNRWSNLRAATRSENNRNSKVRRHSSLGVKGVQTGRSEKFTAKIQFDGRQVHLGTFETMEEASKAYEAAANKSYGEFARSK